MGMRSAIPTAALLCILAGRASAEVTVTTKPATVERKTFDPRHPPADMPPLNSGEAAVTESQFDCTVDVGYQVLERKTVGDQCEDRVKVQRVAVTLQLKIAIWLPDPAPPKLAAHEEGHRQIVARVYDGAEAAARQLATQLDGHTLSASAGDCKAAEKRATQTAINQLCRDYLDRTAEKAARVGRKYDELTAHGTRADPKEPEAIRQAFAEEEKPAKPPREE